LVAGEKLYLGEYLLSANGCFKLAIEPDGKLAVRQVKTGKVIWSTNNAGKNNLKYSF
jgi:hypothetical protein